MPSVIAFAIDSRETTSGVMNTYLRRSETTLLYDNLGSV
jgi:hypothetical protein